jgi:hypothetical protein
MRLSDSDLLIGKSGFPASLQARLHCRNRFIAGSCSHPKLALAPFGRDDDPKAVNKSICHVGFLSFEAQSSRLAVFGGRGMSFNICRGTLGSFPRP